MTKTALPIRDICVVGIFAAITAILAQIAIPLPFTPVPISFGIVAVYITGILLHPRCAVFSQICYLAIGAVGIPVFGNFRGGLGALFGPTGGYLLVYPLMVGIVSLVLNSTVQLRTENKRSKAFLYTKTVVALCVAQLALYFGGTLWLSATTGNTFVSTLALAVLPFIPMDIAKIVFCVVFILPVRQRMMQMGLLVEAPTGTI